jgi:transcriptional regulator with XRE-family HTH domain
MPMTTMIKIGLRLRSIRQSAGLSLNDVADRTDDYFKASCIGAYERGERVIPADRLVELAEFYQVPAWRILSGITP